MWRRQPELESGVAGKGWPLCWGFSVAYCRRDVTPTSAQGPCAGETLKRPRRASPGAGLALKNVCDRHKFSSRQTKGGRERGTWLGVSGGTSSTNACEATGILPSNTCSATPPSQLECCTSSPLPFTALLTSSVDFLRLLGKHGGSLFAVSSLSVAALWNRA